MRFQMIEGPGVSAQHGANSSSLEFARSATSCAVRAAGSVRVWWLHPSVSRADDRQLTVEGCGFVDEHRTSRTGSCHTRTTSGRVKAAGRRATSFMTTCRVASPGCRAVRHVIEGIAEYRPEAPGHILGAGSVAPYTAPAGRLSVEA
jgi:hypothetical protein